MKEFFQFIGGVVVVCVIMLAFATSAAGITRAFNADKYNRCVEALVADDIRDGSHNMIGYSSYDHIGCFRTVYAVRD